MPERACRTRSIAQSSEFNCRPRKADGRTHTRGRPVRPASVAGRSGRNSTHCPGLHGPWARCSYTVRAGTARIHAWASHLPTANAAAFVYLAPGPPPSHRWHSLHVCAISPIELGASIGGPGGLGLAAEIVNGLLEGADPRHRRPARREQLGRQRLLGEDASSRYPGIVRRDDEAVPRKDKGRNEQGGGVHGPGRSNGHAHETV